MDIRNEVKSYIVREGMTMTALLEKLADLNCSGVITNFPGICRAWRG